MDIGELMQPQAKALGDPSRFRLFQYIAEAAAPVGVAELTELLGFNHNAIRQHLAVLVDAGLVTESNEKRDVRGRPRKLYQLRADALSAFSSISGSYQRLAELLLVLAGGEETPYDVGYRSAQPLLQNGEPEEVDSMVQLLVRELAVDGFDPAQLDATTIELQNCPFAGVASKNPGIVCELHRGVIDGHVSASQSRFSSSLVVSDPQRAGCRVAVTLRDEEGANP